MEDVEAADADEKKSSSDDGGGGVSDGRLTAVAGGSGSSISTGCGSLYSYFLFSF